MIKIGRKRGEIRCVAEHRCTDEKVLKETGTRISVFMESLYHKKNNLCVMEGKNDNFL